MISLLPGDSDGGDGLRYQLYQQRFAELTNLSAAEVEDLLPPQHGPWEYFGSADPDWQGFQGLIKTREEIDRIVGALSKVAPSELTGS